MRARARALPAGAPFPRGRSVIGQMRSVGQARVDDRIRAPSSARPLALARPEALGRSRVRSGLEWIPARAVAVAGGLVATGLAAPRAPLLVWALPPIAGLGLGAASTAASTAVGISVEQGDQGQAQAVLLLLGYVGAALGCLLGPRLYAPEASVLRASLPFLVGAGVTVATALGLIATAPRHVEMLEEALLEDDSEADPSAV